MGEREALGKRESLARREALAGDTNFFVFPLRLLYHFREDNFGL